MSTRWLQPGSSSRAGIRRAALCAALAASLAASGCVQRRLTIRSNPPGALVYVDNYQIGTTPVSTPFTYYGTRKIRLVKDGYETVTVEYPIRAPWYQVPPLDFVAENVIPWEIRDERGVDFQLVPQVMVPTEQLLSRAEQLRRSAQPAPPAIGFPPAVAPPGLLPAPPGVPAPGVSPPGVLPAPIQPLPPVEMSPNQPVPARPPGAAP